jgi:hypothetical protein
MKTATTTLQKRVFQKHEGLYYIGGPEYIDDTFRNAVSAIVKHDRIQYDSAYQKENISNALSLAREQEKPILLSAEALSTQTLDRLTKAERLVDLFDDVKILICLRQPVSLIVSFYSEYVKQINPGFEKLRDLNDWLDCNWSEERATSVTRILDFSCLIKAYRELVGENNVCVMLFEDLSSRPDYFSDQLSEFLGIDSARTLELLKVKRENESVSDLDYRIIKIANRFGSTAWLPYAKSLLPQSAKKLIRKYYSNKKTFPLSDEWKMKIIDYSRHVNHDLCKLIGTGPEKYNYLGYTDLP